MENNYTIYILELWKINQMWIKKSNRKLEMFLKYYALIQLYIFIAVILLNGFAVLLYPKLFVKEAIITENPGPDNEIPGLIDSGYQKITEEELRELEKKKDLYNIIGITGVIGWCISNPDFRRNIKKLKEKLINEIEKRA